ncbi:MAG: cupin domain-containing protein [Actinomycetota bacterium]|nr:cupin domain-containing protein [Actinomycetota bacterium]
MRHWNLSEIDAPTGSRSPVVLDSDDAARAVLVVLEPGQALGDHQVKEHAFMLIFEGKAQVEAAGERLEAEPGALFRFDPDERHSVATDSGTRLLLFLAPWPGEGHYRGGGAAR